MTSKRQVHARKGRRTRLRAGKRPCQVSQDSTVCPRSQGGPSCVCRSRGRGSPLGPASGSPVCWRQFPRLHQEPPALPFMEVLVRVRFPGAAAVGLGHKEPAGLTHLAESKSGYRGLSWPPGPSAECLGWPLAGPAVLIHQNPGSRAPPGPQPPRAVDSALAWSFLPHRNPWHELPSGEGDHPKPGI